MSRKPQKSATAPPAANANAAYNKTPREVTNGPVSSPLLQSGLIAAVSLFFARWWVPVESAAAGDTALLVLPWMLLLALMGWLLSTNRLPESFLKLDLGDLGLMLIGLGAVVGCGAVWLLGGQLRAALNMTWEWLGIVAAVLLLRRFWGATRSSVPLAVLLGIGLTLALQGTYQHSVQLPSQRAAVLPMIEEFRQTRDQLQADEITPAARQRLQAAQQSQERELFENGIPTEPRALQMFVERLNSTEPFAQFALTNTLAGVLLICLLLQLSLAIELWRNPAAVSAWQKVLLVVAVGATFYCLILTKSRTAWVAGLLGVLLLTLQWPRNQAARRHLVQAGAGAVLLLVVGVGAALLTGAVDLEVITEANKSLSYRVEYWTASLAMLQDHWATGVGPGNFRQNYLAYKLPYSSEEILDPHNLWLDAWAGTGLIGLIGLGIVVFAILRRAWVLFLLTEKDDAGEAATQPHSLKPVLIATGLSGVWALLLVSPEIAPLFEVVALLTILGMIAAACIDQIFARATLPLSAISVAAVAALVHLHGAGGFSMPGIMAAVILLGLGPSSISPNVDSPAAKSNPWAGPALIGMAVLFIAAGSVLVVRPELASWTANMRLANANSSRAAQIAMHDWAEADSFNPAPWMQLGQMYASLAKEAAETEQQAYVTAAIEALEKAIPLDPANHHLYRAIAGVYAEQGAMGNSEASAEAVRYQKLAVARYPGSAELQAELSAYLATAGHFKESASVAAEALRIHQLNEEAGHVDRLLNEETVSELKKRIDVGENPNTSVPET